MDSGIWSWVSAVLTNVQRWRCFSDRARPADDAFNTLRTLDACADNLRQFGVLELCRNGAEIKRAFFLFFPGSIEAGPQRDFALQQHFIALQQRLFPMGKTER